MANSQGNTSGGNSLNNKIDALNNSINDLVDVLEKLSAKTQSSGGGGSNNPFIRPGSRRTSNQRDRDRSFYYEWSQYYKAPKRGKKWADMSDEEKKSYNEKKNNRKQEAQNYVRRSQQREDLYRDLRSSRMGSTALGRYATNLMERNQRIEDYGMMGKYMQTNAGKIGKGLFGNGKAGAAATKAIGGFGKAIGGASKLLGTSFASAVLMAIDALKLFFQALSAYDKHTGEMYHAQSKQEQLQYDLTKQNLQIENQMKIENVSAQGDIQMKMLETQSATMLDALKLTSAQYAKSVETAISPLTKGINQSAYDAMRASTQAAADYQKLLRHKGQRETEQERYESLRNLQKTGKLAGLEAEKGVAEAQYTSGMRQTAWEYEQADAKHWIMGIGRDEKNNILNSNGSVTTEEAASSSKNPLNGKSFDYKSTYEAAGLGKEYDVTKAGQFMRDIGLASNGEIDRLTEKLAYTNQVLNQNADANKTLVDMQYQLATTQKDYATQIANKQLEVTTEAADIVTDTALEIKNMFIDLSQKTEQWIEKFDRTTNDLAKNLGYTNSSQIRAFQDVMFENAKIAAKFGKTTEDLAKVQQSYIENTGRNRIMGQNDTEKITALGAYLGDDGLAANYASEMEIFNAGVSDSVDMLGETLEDVNRIGLNGRKYTKILVDNLKLAQKYNFKDGTKGLMNMAKWAENTRFNMNSLSSMLDKVSEGGLEGIIKQGAEFQVLGGHAAMNADPIAMWYERYADPQAFAKRMQDMTKGYGQLDKKTGETTFSVNEQMMMEQLAKIQGRSYEDVANEVRARNKKEVVAKQFRSKFNEDQQSFISNNATYNKETGQFQVKVRGANGKLVEKDVSQLTPEDLENIMPADYQGKMLKNMEDIVDLLGKAFGEEERERIETGQGVFDNTIKNQLERIAKARANFEEHKDEYIGKINEIQDETTKQFTNFLEMASKGNQAVDNEAAKISATASNINAALQTTANIIAQANAKIASAGGIEYTKPTSDGKFTLPSNTTNVPTEAKTKVNVSSAIKGKSSVLSMASAVAEEAHNVITNPKATEKQKKQAFRDNAQMQVGNALLFKDGIVNNNNKPIVSSASNVTKINDGLVQSDPKDVAIFAKEGGVIGNFLNDLYNDVHSANSGTISLDTVNVTISGSLDLSSGGQSVNIINELQTNPMLLRSLSRMLAQQISSAMNGGRGTSSMGIGSV